MGVGYYEDLDVRLIKDATAVRDSDWVRFITGQHLRSRMVIAHTRTATRGIPSYANAQPFVRELAGRAHLFAHNGDLPGIFASADLQPKRFKPIGDTDSEQALCVLLDRMLPIWTDRNVRAPLLRSVRDGRVIRPRAAQPWAG
jgi:glutamine amidotransferase